MTTYVATSDPEGWQDMTCAALRIAKAPSKVSADRVRNVLRYLADSTPSTLRLADITSGRFHEYDQGCELLSARLADDVSVDSYDLNDVTVTVTAFGCSQRETIHFERVGYLGGQYGPIVANLTAMVRYSPDGTTWFAYRNLGDLIVDRSSKTIGLRGFKLA